jgi:acyl-CoA synthetase (AMP-forming)/AMP-acid ligase II
MEGSLKSVEKVVVLGAHARHESYEAWVACHPADDPGRTSAPDDVAMQLYTSGTTGLPKGAMLTNASLGTLLPCVGPFWHFDETSVNLVCMPLFHIGGSGWALVGMGMGGHSILVREFVPQEILATLERHRVTNALFVPAMLQFLTMVPGAADRDYSALRSVVYGASPITNEVLVRSMKALRCPFIQVYGLTETTGAITQLPAEDHEPEGPRARLLRSAGRPFPWVELRIVEPGGGTDCARGAVGEIWTRSVQNFKGYWGRLEETARTLDADGWLRTGDAGFLDEDGYLFLTDRVKDMIISGGENVYPAEVENALFDHPAIADVAVIGVPDDRWGETVKAIVSGKPEWTRSPWTSSPSPASGSRTTSARPPSTSRSRCPATLRAGCSSASCASPTGEDASAASTERARPYWAKLRASNLAQYGHPACRCSAGSPKRCAVSAAASNWMRTAGSRPTTQASCPGSTTTTCGAANSKTQPSPYFPWTLPEVRNPTCPCMHSSVPMSGFMWVDQRNPGGYTTRLIWPLAAATESILRPAISWCRAPLIARSPAPAGFATLYPLATGAFRRLAFGLFPLPRFTIDVPSLPLPCRARDA